MFIKFLTLLFLLFTPKTFAIPILTGPIVDEAKVLTPQGKADLENTLHAFFQTGKGQIQILTIKSLDGESIENFSIKLAETWKIGDKAKGNGVIVVASIEDRAIRIEVGNGIEGELTDAHSRRIIEQAKPYLRQQNYDQAFKEIVRGIITRLDPQAIPQNEERNISEETESDFDFNRLIFIFIALLIFFFINRRGGGGSGYRGGSSGGSWSSGSGGSWGGGGSSWGGGGGGYSGGGSSSKW